MSATLTPYPESESPSIPTNSDAYIPVRVTEAPRPDGSTLVYLPDGTALVVNRRHLLRLDPDQSGDLKHPTTGEAEHRAKDPVADDHRRHSRRLDRRALLTPRRRAAPRRMFNLAVSLDRDTTRHGWPLGRVVACSTFHHIADMNWDTGAGAPSFVNDPPGDEITRDPSRLAIFKDYVHNIARWLAAATDRTQDRSRASKAMQQHAPRRP